MTSSLSASLAVVSVLLAGGTIITTCKSYIDNVFKLSKKSPQALSAVFLIGSWYMAVTLNSIVQNFHPITIAKANGTDVDILAVLMRAAFGYAAVTMCFGPFLILTPTSKIILEKETLFKALVSGAQKKSARTIFFVLFVFLTAIQGFVVYSLYEVMWNQMGLSSQPTVVIGIIVAYALICLLFILMFYSVMMQKDVVFGGINLMEQIRRNIIIPSSIIGHFNRKEKSGDPEESGESGESFNLLSHPKYTYFYLFLFVLVTILVCTMIGFVFSVDISHWDSYSDIQRALVVLFFIFNVTFVITCIGFILNIAFNPVNLTDEVVVGGIVVNINYIKYTAVFDRQTRALLAEYGNILDPHLESIVSWVKMHLQTCVNSPYYTSIQSVEPWGCFSQMNDSQCIYVLFTGSEFHRDLSFYYLTILNEYCVSNQYSLFSFGKTKSPSYGIWTKSLAGFISHLNEIFSNPDNFQELHSSFAQVSSRMANSSATFSKSPGHSITSSAQSFERFWSEHERSTQQNASSYQTASTTYSQKLMVLLKLRPDQLVGQRLSLRTSGLSYGSSPSRAMKSRKRGGIGFHFNVSLPSPSVPSVLKRQNKKFSGAPLVEFDAELEMEDMDVPSSSTIPPSVESDGKFEQVSDGPVEIESFSQNGDKNQIDIDRPATTTPTPPAGQKTAREDLGIQVAEEKAKRHQPPDEPLPSPIIMDDGLPSPMPSPSPSPGADFYASLGTSDRGGTPQDQAQARDVGRDGEAENRRGAFGYFRRRSKAGEFVAIGPSTSAKQAKSASFGKKRKPEFFIPSDPEISTLDSKLSQESELETNLIQNAEFLKVQLCSMEATEFSIQKDQIDPKDPLDILEQSPVEFAPMLSPLNMVFDPENPNVLKSLATNAKTTFGGYSVSSLKNIAASTTANKYVIWEIEIQKNASILNFAIGLTTPHALQSESALGFGMITPTNNHVWSSSSFSALKIVPNPNSSAQNPRNVTFSTIRNSSFLSQIPLPPILGLPGDTLTLLLGPNTTSFAKNGKYCYTVANSHISNLLNQNDGIADCHLFFLANTKGVPISEISISSVFSTSVNPQFTHGLAAFAPLKSNKISFWGYSHGFSRSHVSIPVDEQLISTFSKLQSSLPQMNDDQGRFQWYELGNSDHSCPLYSLEDLRTMNSGVSLIPPLTSVFDDFLTKLISFKFLWSSPPLFQSQSQSSKFNTIWPPLNSRHSLFSGCTNITQFVSPDIIPTCHSINVLHRLSLLNSVQAFKIGAMGIFLNQGASWYQRSCSTLSAQLVVKSLGHIDRISHVFILPGDVSYLSLAPIADFISNEEDSWYFGQDPEIIHIDPDYALFMVALNQLMGIVFIFADICTALIKSESVIEARLRIENYCLFCEPHKPHNLSSIKSGIATTRGNLPYPDYGACEREIIISKNPISLLHILESVKDSLSAMNNVLPEIRKKMEDHISPSRSVHNTSLVQKMLNLSKSIVHCCTFIKDSVLVDA